MKIGDIVNFQITKVSGYACWGTAEQKTGFSHCVDWSIEKPVPKECYPEVGQTIKARVFHLTAPGEKVPADVSHGGEIRVDFACSFALVDDAEWGVSSQAMPGLTTTRTGYTFT